MLDFKNLLGLQKFALQKKETLILTVVFTIMFKNHGRSRHSSKNLPLGKTLRSQQHHEYLNTRRWIFLNKNKHCLTQYLFTFLTSQDILEKSKQPVRP